MAANPLFTSYRHYPPLCSHHSQRFNMSRNSDYPPEKRRRTEESEMQLDEMWDEDIEFSQADIQSLDVMASQAFHPKDQTEGQQKENVNRRQQTVPVASEFQQPAPKPSTSRLSRKNSSSTSSLSLSRNSTNSSTSYPSSMSSRRSSMQSISSNSSIDSGKGDSRFVHQTEDPVALRTRLAELEKEWSLAKDNLYSKDGEIKILRDSLKKKDVDLAKLREDRVHSLDQLSSEKAALQESWKSEKDRLQTQLQFRDQEFKELEDRCRHLEQKLTVSPAKHSSPKAVSPVRRRVRPDLSPVSKSSFPSRHSFMSDEAANTIVRPSTSTADVPREVFRKEDKGKRVRKHVLHTPVMGGEVSGGRLVSQLLQQSCKGEKDEGIVGLLHTPLTPVYLPHLQFDRDNASAVLSPIRGRRLSDVHARLQHKETVDSVGVVSRDHYLLAVQGLRDLVESPARCADCLLNSGREVSQTEELSGAVLILPLINDYLSRYLDMLSSTSASVSQSSGATSSSSLGKTSDSSLESVTSSMGQLIKDCQNFANNLEYLSISSLRTLLKLVEFSRAVRRSLINKTDSLLPHSDWSSTGRIQVSVDSSASGEMAMDTDLTVTSSSETDTMSLESRVTFQQLQELNLLYRVATLAHPQQENYSIAVVEAALNIMVVLASKWQDNDHVRLHLALSRGALSRCLECRSSGENSWGVITRAAIVLGHLARTRKVVDNLCNKSDSCPLLHLYLVSLKLTDAVKWETREIIYVQTVMCLSRMLCDLSGSTVVFANKCHCSGEAGRSLVTCLLHLYQHYQSFAPIPARIQRCLHAGLLLLHQAQQRHDNYLIDRDWELQDEYVALICGLTTLFKHLPGNQDADLNALSDLWDFNQDDSELSPDSDPEDMDT